MKKLLSLVLALCMLCSVVPALAYTAGEYTATGKGMIGVRGKPLQTSLHRRFVFIFHRASPPFVRMDSSFLRPRLRREEMVPSGSSIISAISLMP